MFKQKVEFASDPELYYTYRLLTLDVWISEIDELEVMAGDVVNLINMCTCDYPQLCPTDTRPSYENCPLQGRLSGGDKIQPISSTSVWCLYGFDDESDGIVCTVVDDSMPLATATL